MSYLTYLFASPFASPIFRVLLVVGLGLALGHVRLPGGFRLGVAAVLFAGLAMGAFVPNFTLPTALQDLGLILFVYGIGLQTGPGFFRSFKKDGIKLNGAIVGGLIFASIICVGLIRFLHVPAQTVAGLFCGSLTNTPALGAATEALGKGAGAAAQANAVVIGYGVAYPFAILVVLSVIQFIVSRNADSIDRTQVDSALEVRTLTIGDTDHHQDWTARAVEARYHVRLTRCCLPNGDPELMKGDMVLVPHTLVTVVGTPDDISRLSRDVGKTSSMMLQAAPGDLEVTDLRVSNRTICGLSIHQVETLYEGIVISRIRRGDTELSASPEIKLQPGDEVRVVVHRSRFGGVARFFGNSVMELSESCYMTYVLGILLGLWLGSLSIMIPGLPAPLRLGMAGGPLLVGLFLGWIGRTGPLVWTLPYDLNLGIRNFGILLFLAVVGSNAGSGLWGAIQAQGTMLILSALVLAVGTHLVAWVIMRLMKERDVSTVVGALAGLQTQPAALSFASDRASATEVQLGYASVYPLATILKIIIAQVLLGIH